MMIDLSFTKDEEWIAERKKIWNKWSPGLEKTLTVQQLGVVEKYFMTGQESAEYKLSDGALLDYFPLQTAEGWDYVFENFVVKESEFRDFLNESIQDRSDMELFPHKALSELERWDYFFGEEFEPVIKSRVPVGKGQKIIELGITPVDTFASISAMVLMCLERGKGGVKPKWLARSEYFFSLLSLLDNSCFDNPERRSREAKASAMLRYIFEHIVEYKPEVDFEDVGGVRNKFLSDFEKELDKRYDNLCSGLQKLWDETKSKKYG